MSLPLTEFTIERFRGIHRLELKELGRVNLLLGPNNSGKTSVLEALLLYSRPLDPLAWQGAAAMRDGVAVQNRIPGLLRWLYPAVEGSARAPDAALLSCSLLGKGAFPLRSVESIYTQLVRMSTLSQASLPKEDVGLVPVATSPEGLEPSRREGAQISVVISGSSLGDAPPGQREGTYTFWPDEFFARQGPVPDPKLLCAFVSPYGHRSEQALTRQMKQATLEESKPDVLKLIQRLDDTIEDLESLPGFGQEASLFIKLRGAGYLPVSGMGDGVRRALTVALALLEAQNGILLIDELESAFHFSALQQVFSWLVSACHQYGVQLFATTHSLEAVDAILAADPTPEEDIVAYRLERRGARYQAVRFGEGELRFLRDELGQEIR